METARPTGLERRRTPRQARSTATVESIFDATTQVLVTVGPLHLTTTRVAMRAGVSIGTLYQYFPHKEALLYGALERHLTTIVDAVELACHKHRGASVAEMGDAMVRAYLGVKADQSNESLAFYRVSISLDSHGAIEAATLRGDRAVAAMLSTASDRHFPAPDVIAQVLLAAITGAVRAFFERGMPPDLDGEIGRQLSQMRRSYLLGALPNTKSDRLIS